MSAPSLREIEKTLAKLWMDEQSRKDFLKNDRLPDSVTFACEIDKDGVRLYGSLIRHGRQDLMRSIYPHCARLLGKNWEGIVDDYVKECPPDHFNLNRVARRFSEYLGSHMEQFKKRFPYLQELADYEWLELELLEIDVPISIEPAVQLSKPESFTDFAPVTNPVMAVREYEYPIYKIVEQLETSKRLPRNVTAGKSFVAVYRDPRSNRCRFMELGDVAAAVIAAGKDGNVTYADLVALAVARSPQSDPQVVVEDFIALVEKLHDLCLFVGSKALSKK